MNVELRINDMVSIQSDILKTQFADPRSATQALRSLQPNINSFGLCVNKVVSVEQKRGALVVVVDLVSSVPAQRDSNQADLRIKSYEAAFHRLREPKKFGAEAATELQKARQAAAEAKRKQEKN